MASHDMKELHSRVVIADDSVQQKRRVNSVLFALNDRPSRMRLSLSRESPGTERTRP
jgi:hypothetical protein